MKTKLPTITLLGIDCVNAVRLQEALDISEEKFIFASTKLLTSLPIEDDRLIKIPHLGSIEEYSKFCMEELHRYVETNHVLLIQHDGFILNPTTWTNDFLHYDYIGAPWLVTDWAKKYDFPEKWLDTKVVGNGGFSLRSKKLLKTAANLSHSGRIPKKNPEDIAMCVWHRSLFEEKGIKFAPLSVAEKFSLEGDDRTLPNPFGFHSFVCTDVSPWVKNFSKYPETTKSFKKGLTIRKQRDNPKPEKASPSRSPIAIPSLLLRINSHVTSYFRNLLKDEG